jgi:hypothetical protein
MFRTAVVFGGLLAVLAVGWVTAQQAPKPVPKLEPVAETRLLCEGINLANFRGLERLLKEKPTEVAAWTFARGQALLIAENANLLMLRPPRNQGQDAWMTRATELRNAGTLLARSASDRDHVQCRARLHDVAAVCTRCHQNFRVPVKIAAFADPDERKTGRAPAEGDSGR